MFGPPLHYIFFFRYITLHLCQCGHNKLKNCNSTLSLSPHTCRCSVACCICHGAFAKCMSLQKIIHVRKLFATIFFYESARLSKNWHWNSESCSCRKQNGILASASRDHSNIPIRKAPGIFLQNVHLLSLPLLIKSNRTLK